MQRFCLGRAALSRAAARLSAPLLAAGVWLVMPVRAQSFAPAYVAAWRKAWFPEAPVYPVVLRPGGHPNAMADLMPMSSAQIQAMRMIGAAPTRAIWVHWFLEGMLQHNGIHKPE